MGLIELEAEDDSNKIRRRGSKLSRILLMKRYMVGGTWSDDQSEKMIQTRFDGVAQNQPASPHTLPFILQFKELPISSDLVAKAQSPLTRWSSRIIPSCTVNIGFDDTVRSKIYEILRDEGQVRNILPNIYRYIPLLLFFNQNIRSWEHLQPTYYSRYIWVHAFKNKLRFYK